MGKCVRSIVSSILRRSVTPLAAAIGLLGATGINSASADVTYTSYDWYGDVVNITSPHGVTGGAGQITLHLNNNTTILAWCLDVYDDLQNKGVYSVNPNGPINGGNTAQSPGHIGALILEGNNLIAAHATYQSWTTKDISAAVQIA